MDMDTDVNDLFHDALGRTKGGCRLIPWRATGLLMVR